MTTALLSFQRQVHLKFLPRLKKPTNLSQDRTCNYRRKTNTLLIKPRRPTLLCSLDHPSRRLRIKPAVKSLKSKCTLWISYRSRIARWRIVESPLLISRNMTRYLTNVRTYRFFTRSAVSHTTLNVDECAHQGHQALGSLCATIKNSAIVKVENNKRRTGTCS